MFDNSHQKKIFFSDMMVFDNSDQSIQSHINSTMLTSIQSKYKLYTTTSKYKFSGYNDIDRYKLERKRERNRIAATKCRSGFSSLKLYHYKYIHRVFIIMMSEFSTKPESACALFSPPLSFSITLSELFLRKTIERSEAICTHTKQEG